MMCQRLSRRAFLAASALGATLLVPRRDESHDCWQRWPLERRIAQLLLVGFAGTRLEPGAAIVRDLRELQIGGVVLYDRDGRNITGPAQLRALTAALTNLAATAPFIAVDQEGGQVVRLKERDGFLPTLSAQALGAAQDPALTAHHAQRIAHSLADCGLNLNFAPVVDLNRNPDNPVIARMERSFSADPQRVVGYAAALIAAQRRCGVIAALKHFPGHGSSTEDSHVGFVDVTRTWHRDELLPYRRLIGQGLCEMVMTAHIYNARLDPHHPATLSQPTITGLLRGRLGFRGVVVSDDLRMGAIARYYAYDTAVIRALTAGVDLLLISNHRPYDPDIVPKTLAIIARAVADGVLTPARIDRSCRRILALKARYRDFALVARSAHRPFRVAPQPLDRHPDPYAF